MVVETEVSTPTSEPERLSPSPEGLEPSLVSVAVDEKTIQQTFQEFQSQWIDDPIIRQWRDPDHRVHQVLSDVNELYRTWTTRRHPPFHPSANPLYRQIGRTLADVGLPWHNNQINMPDEVDTSWPFHFKSFERKVIRAKGARLGDPLASGYVCNYSEANLYCIRALQQELRERCPTREPLLVYEHFNEKLVRSAEVFFGLEPHRLRLSDVGSAAIPSLRTVTANCTRPIIFTATLGNDSGKADNLGMLLEISKDFPVILHIDASRNFDYVTTVPDTTRDELGIPRLALRMKALDGPLLSDDGAVLASTIVAGGLNLDISAPAIALKPATLGGQSVQVEYTRASDSALAGSRDAISILWLALQEIQLGESGYRSMYQRCAEARDQLVRTLHSRGMRATTSPYSLDVIINACSEDQAERLRGLGGVLTEESHVILGFQPPLTMDDTNTVLQTLFPSDEERLDRNFPETLTSHHKVPQSTITEIQDTIQSWKVATRSAAGYPFHMGSLSALGPVIGRFLDVQIPDDWVQSRSREILAARMKTFGLRSVEDRSEFQGAFTNGSTMGNRIGILVALLQLPGAFVYFSSETHYSVAKTLRDSDALTNRWAPDGRGPRFARIPCTEDGSMSVKALVRHAVTHRQMCLNRGEEYRMVLFANMGTTFVGARDDLARIRTELHHVGISISYIHVDGALDFGYDDCGIALGPPGLNGPGQMPLVQGITLSHHKALGSTVSGEVVCYSPNGELASLASPVEPRIVFETWLYTKVYTRSDVALMLSYCRTNATRLVRGLDQIGMATKRNGEGLIVVLERPPAWITEEFSLRPEGDWVHFITMPHISPETVDFFVDRIASIDRQCTVAFSYVAPLLSSAFRKPVTLKRVHCQGAEAAEITKLSRVVVDSNGNHDQHVDAIVKTCLRGALSVAVADNSGKLQAVFLVEPLGDMSIRVGPVLLASYHHSTIREVRDIGQQLMGFLARHVYAKLRVDEKSYEVYLF